jgi:DNA processing protein
MTDIINLDERFGTSRALWGPQVSRLWYMGDLSLLEFELPRVSIVGTRNITPDGRLRTMKLVNLLVSKGVCIVSGLASGIDTVAHETALDIGGRTIAVMGTSIDDCYPKENRALKDRIAANGLILSQFAPSEPVNRSNFPRRNALMAAISAVTFVVEAEVNSGTRHQVSASLRLGKRVAFLASLANRNFAWVDDAISSGHGFVVQQPEDAVQLLTILHLKARGSTQKNKHASLGGEVLPKPEENPCLSGLA